MDLTTSPATFFLCGFASLAVGAVLGRLDRLTFTNPTLILGAACCGLGEFAILFLYHEGYLSIDDSFRVAAGFLVAGMLGLGCGAMKAGRALQIQQDQLKAERAAEDALIRQSGATEGVCPYCDAIIALSSQQCSACGALLGPGSGREVKLLRRSCSQDSPWRV